MDYRRLQERKISYHHFSALQLFSCCVGVQLTCIHPSFLVTPCQIGAPPSLSLQKGQGQCKREEKLFVLLVCMLVQQIQTLAPKSISYNNPQLNFLESETKNSISTVKHFNGPFLFPVGFCKKDLLWYFGTEIKTGRRKRRSS